MLQRIRLCVAALASMTSLAATNALAVNNIWITPTTVNKVYPGTTGASFYMDGAAISSSSVCASQNRFQILSTHPNYYAIYSLLLTALAEQKPVGFSYDDDSTDCAVTVNYITIEK